MDQRRFFPFLFFLTQVCNSCSTQSPLTWYVLPLTFVQVSWNNIPHGDQQQFNQTNHSNPRPLAGAETRPAEQRSSNAKSLKFCSAESHRPARYFPKRKEVELSLSLFLLWITRLRSAAMRPHLRQPLKTHPQFESWLVFRVSLLARIIDLFIFIFKL